MNIQSISTHINNTVDQQNQSPAQKSGEKKAKDSVHLNNSNVNTSGYNKKGQSLEAAANTESRTNVHVLKNQIHKEIWDQAYTLLKAYSEKSGTTSAFEDGMARILESGSDSQDAIGLNAYYTEHPEDWAQVQQGEIPDYFNVENTAQRILQIWVGDKPPEGSSASWLQNIKDLIGQSYQEVSDMIGGLPQLVLDTKDYIENKIDQWIADSTGNKENQDVPDNINFQA